MSTPERAERKLSTNALEDPAQGDRGIATKASKGPGLPPGPHWGRLAGTVRFHRDPLAVLRTLRRDYGDIFTIRLASTGPVIVVAEPATARRVMHSDPPCARAGQARRGVLPMASALSTFGSDGTEHERARRRIEPLFSEDHLRARASGIRARVKRHVERLPASRPFRLLPRMRALADEIFVAEVLGISDEPCIARFARAIGEMLRTPGNPPTTIPAPDQGLLGALVDAEYSRRRRPLARLLEDEIDRRRAALAPGGGVLGALLRDEPERSTEAIIEELLALLMAAQEPMAAALTWVVLRAACEPGVWSRLRETGAESKWGKAVVAESLRLTPPAIASLRTTAEPMELGGHRIPCGLPLLVPIPLLLRDGRLFDNPDLFIPERHLPDPDGLPAQPHLDSSKPAWLMPFGGGSRECVAPLLARMEIESLLEELLSHGSVRPLSRQPERMVLRATILVPQRSGLVIAGLAR